MRRPAATVAGGAGSLDRLRLWQRFHVRLTALYGATVFLTLTAMAVAFNHRVADSAIEQLRGRLLATAVALSQSVSPELVARLGRPADLDNAEYRALMTSFAAVAAGQPEVMSIYLLRPSGRQGWLRFAADWSRDGRPAVPGELYDATQAPRMLAGLRAPVAEEELYTDEFGTSLSAYAPVVAADGERLGLLGVDVWVPTIERLRREVLGVTLGLYLLASLLLGVAAWLVGRHVRRPLDRIIAAAQAITHGDLAARTRLERGDEFGIVGRRLDRIAVGLAERDAIRSTFRRFVSGSVAERILADPTAGRLGGEELEVTVLFCGLAGYREAAEQLAPVQVVELLNRYLSAMADLVDEHGGSVLEFVGDEVLAVFGAPDPQPDHAERAARCALAMRERLALLNREWEEAGLAVVWRAKVDGGLGPRLGLHSGPVVAGNLGSSTRLKYGIIGDAVNVAARTQGLQSTLGADLLLTRETRDRLPAELRERTVHRGAHAVKGRQQTVDVYSL